MTTLLKAATAACFAALFATTTHAATLLIDGGGNLTGATDVDVDGTLYDVTFAVGTCGDVFTGCEELSDFAFQTSASATMAAQALLDQVFVDTGPGMLFDTDPELTFGCTGTVICYASVPFNLSQFSVFDARAANFFPGPSDFVLNGSSWTFDIDFTTRSENTWAVFAPAAAEVPLPAPILLLMGGLAGMGALRRKA